MSAAGTVDRGLELHCLEIKAQKLKHLKNTKKLEKIFELEYLNEKQSIHSIKIAINLGFVKNETDFHTLASKYFQDKGDLLTAAWAAERAGLQEKSDLLREQFKFNLEREMYFWPIGYHKNL